jgi:hypothetical protein
VSDRFSDNLALVAVDDYVPTTVHALLIHLRLDQAPRDRQENGIRDWLDSHPPGRGMAYTMTRSGFGHLLNNRAPA